MKHIYIGMSKKVYCREQLQRDQRGRLVHPEDAPITEGEYIDGYHAGELCPDCVEAIRPVRGEPTRVLNVIPTKRPS